METPRNRKLRRPQLGESDRPVSIPPSEQDITVPDKIAGSAALRLRERVSIKILISSSLRAVPIFQNLVCTVIALSRLLPVDYVHRVPQQPSHRTQCVPRNPDVCCRVVKSHVCETLHDITKIARCRNATNGKQ